MTRRSPSEIFKKTYENYLVQVNTMDFSGCEDLLGLESKGSDYLLPFFGRNIIFTKKGFFYDDGRAPSFEISVVLFRYLIMCPSRNLDDKEWVAFRNFPDAGPLTVFWSDTVENRIASTFRERRNDLEAACRALGFHESGLSLSYDLHMIADALPRVPLLILFNDDEDDFPSSASVLFQERAIKYLDAESLSILGGVLVKKLIGAHS